MIRNMDAALRVSCEPPRGRRPKKMGDRREHFGIFPVVGSPVPPASVMTAIAGSHPFTWGDAAYTARLFIHHGAVIYFLKQTDDTDTSARRFDKWCTEEMLLAAIENGSVALAAAARIGSARS